MIDKPGHPTAPPGPGDDSDRQAAWQENVVATVAESRKLPPKYRAELAQVHLITALAINADTHHHVPQEQRNELLQSAIADCRERMLRLYSDVERLCPVGAGCRN